MLIVLLHISISVATVVTRMTLVVEQHSFLGKSWCANFNQLLYTGSVDDADIYETHFYVWNKMTKKS